MLNTLRQYTTDARLLALLDGSADRATLVAACNDGGGDIAYACYSAHVYGPAAPETADAIASVVLAHEHYSAGPSVAALSSYKRRKQEIIAALAPVGAYSADREQ